VYGCGSSTVGQLGMFNNYILTQIPTVKIPTGVKITNITCGLTHTIVQCDNNKLYGCGSNSNYELSMSSLAPLLNEVHTSYATITTIPPIPIKIACGLSYTIAIFNNGVTRYTAFGTGINSYGQAGVSSSSTHEFTLISSLPSNKTPIDVACGTSHTIMLFNDNTIYGFGNNSYGQLGISNTTNQTTAQLMGLYSKTPSSIICGGYHTIVLFSDNTIYGCGNNTSGQLGIGNNTTKIVLTQMILPVDNNGNSKVPIKIVCGNLYTIVLFSDNTIYGCGSNSYGQLSINSNTNTTILTKINLPVDNNGNSKVPQKIACGTAHTMVLFNDNTIYGCGYNNTGQLGIDTQDFSKNILTQMILPSGKIPTSIACGDKYTIVLFTDGTIYGCGDNTDGQLGIFNNYVLTPTTLPSNKTPIKLLLGYSFTVILFDDGTIYGCGYNSNGQLGNGNTISPQTTLGPMTLTNISAKPVNIACGGLHTIVLFSDGTIYGCGNNLFGQLGNGNATTQTTLGSMTLTDISAKPINITCGWYYTIILFNDGTIYGCGTNNYGQLGNGNTTDQSTLVQMTLPVGKTPINIACGSYYTIILFNDGTVYGCGYNNYGQLGNGNTTTQLTLVQMTLPVGKTPINIACGDSHTIILFSDNTIYGCGYDNNGQLGNKTNTNQYILTSMTIPNGKTPINILCGNLYTIVLFSDGTIYGCGFNGNGQLGDGSVINRNILTQMLNINLTNFSIASVSKFTSIMFNGTSLTKQYDGSNNLILSSNMYNLYTYDSLQPAGLTINSSTATYNDKNVNSNIPISININTLTDGTSTAYTFVKSHIYNGSITAKPLTPTFTVTPKEYDKTFDASGTISYTLNNIISGDIVTIPSYTALYTDYNVGNNKTMNISNLTLSNNNYSINNSYNITSGSIIPRTLTPTFTVTPKEYDKTMDASGTISYTLNNIISGDIVTIPSYNALYTDYNVGNNKPINISNLSLSNNNYSINNSYTITNGSITPKTLTPTFTSKTKYISETDTSTLANDNVTYHFYDIIIGDNVSITFDANFISSGPGHNIKINIRNININNNTNYILSINTYDQLYGNVEYDKYTLFKHKYLTGPTVNYGIVFIDDLMIIEKL